MAAQHPATLPLSHPQQEESASLLQRTLLAMTWASHAKDAHLASLASDLHTTLESDRACTDQLSVALNRQRMLEDELQESRSREKASENRLSEALKQLETAEVAEERLSLQIGDLEAESFQRAIETTKLVRSLNERLNEMEKHLKESQSELQQRSSSRGDNVEASYRQLLEQNLKATKVNRDIVKENFTTLKGTLNVTESTDIDVVRNDEVRLQQLLQLF